MTEALRLGLDSRPPAAVVVCPSNPYLSIAPILALPGVRAALERRRVPVIAVSPIVAGRALKGPAAKIMRELGQEPSSLEVARFYRGLIDALVIDYADAALSASIDAASGSQRDRHAHGDARSPIPHIPGTHGGGLGTIAVSPRQAQERAMSICLVLPLKSSARRKTPSGGRTRGKRARRIDQESARALAPAGSAVSRTRANDSGQCVRKHAHAPHDMGTRVLEEKVPGLNHALDQARITARTTGATKMLIVPCDLPLLTADDLRSLAAAASLQTIAIAADRTHAGTNGLCCPHRRASNLPSVWKATCDIERLSSGLAFRIATVERPGLAFDVDTAGRPAAPAQLGISVHCAVELAECAPHNACVCAQRRLHECESHKMSGSEACPVLGMRAVAA